MSRKRLLTCLIVLNLMVIWGNSLMKDTVSDQLSGGLMSVVTGILPFFNGEWGHTLLRKAAHFSEFALLGLLTGLRHGAKFPHMGFGMAVACVDETIQIYIPGRASSLLDVWIDTAGFAAGLGLVLIGHTLKLKLENGGQSK